MIDERDETEVADLEDEYELLNELGRGGSAVVYRARDRVLGREVAIKVVHTRLAGVTDDSIERLAREARTVAKLQHPHIVTVHAVKRLRDGGLALVMQLVPGRTLKQAIVEEGAFSPERAERVMHDVAEALAYAHASGVVHRDVKPENIFLDATTGRALLSDFGIAHSNEFDSRLTMTGAAIGTPSYMSPEQIDGAPANARSDIYSLGLVMWEMLIGQRPWEGETLYNVIFKQKHEELPSIDELRPGVVPPRLQYIVERMLQKKPAARWAGADGLLATLRTWVVPADWRQWEESHQRRRELARAAARSSRATALRGGDTTSAATVRFPRPHAATTSEPIVIPISADARAAGTPLPDAPEEDAAPSWATVPPRRRSWRPAAAVVAALALVAASVGAYAIYRNGRTTPGLQSTRPTDEPAPVVVTQQPAPNTPAPRTPALADSVRLADSASHSSPTAVAHASPRDSTAASVGRGAPSGKRPAAEPPDRPPRNAADHAPASTVNVVSGAPPVAPPPAPGRPSARTTAAAPAKGLPVVPVVPAIRATDDRATIAAGGRHSCVLGSGRVFCWGANDHGQLGNGELESRDLPAGIVGDIEFTQISAGIAHSCGVTRTGDAYCWGSDERGQLGDATTTSRSAPVRVAGNLSFQVVRAGVAHTCGLTTEGEIACWGSNEHGQLGDGSTATRSAPVTLKTAVRFISLATGWNHSCAIATDGVAYCWGDNAAGQLGDDTRTERHTPTAVSGATRFTSIAAGSAHTCAVSDAGEGFCWGRNTYGQLGTGSAVDQNAPARVETAARFASVTLGGVHSCARTRTGQAWCWGRNVYGQLGDGTTGNHDTPVRVAGAAAFTTLSATGAHTCGATTDGETLCWGFNTEGQLGDGTRNHHARPTRVVMPPR